MLLKNFPDPEPALAPALDQSIDHSDSDAAGPAGGDKREFKPWEGSNP